ncbi:adenosine deaminase 2 [Cephus cinctus]|uniref:Adenosine deaminase n=1 Tax=Cephus cinctus TaxID=211228 RepID=A0AAJ7FVJ9_CEPCN|nr:adenosine deaminase 2 [Cephus cinctus]XP_015610400.1 adenosine deaminase 2 [Cephus cinctus]
MPISASICPLLHSYTYIVIEQSFHERKMKVLSTEISFLCMLLTATAQPIMYWELRGLLLADEQRTNLGGSLNFEIGERAANDILMSAKQKEINEAFAELTTFLPARNFMNLVENITESEVFKIIEKMPKGGVLHCHDTGMTSEDYILKNITYRDNLYVCEINGSLSFRFFDSPNDHCNWELLSALREKMIHAENIDRRIHQQISMKVDNPEDVYANSSVAWLKFQSIFATNNPLLTYRPIFFDYVYQGLQELYDDNVFYVELRTTLPHLYELNGTEYGPLETIRAYKEIADRFIADHPDFIGLKVIYAPPRFVNLTRFDEYGRILKEAIRNYPGFVIGFDLVGEEDAGHPLSYFADKLRTFHSDIKFFFHAGETNWYGTSTDNNLLDAVLLNTKRIGHGFALTKHPRVLDIVKKRKIAIEVNPISNQVLRLVTDLRNHPASALFAENVPVVVSNDDPGTWSARALSYDFYEAFMGIMSANADLRSLKQLALNSIVFSGMDYTERARALTLWKKKWANFIGDLVAGNTVICA